MLDTQDQPPEISPTIVGSLPPQLGISPYCAALATALSDLAPVEFLGFRAAYPKFLYPGDRLEDPLSRPPEHANLRIKRQLAWYNPLGWLSAGVRAAGDVLHVQWWSLPLAPVLITLLLVARARRIPTICTVHNVKPHESGWAFDAASRVLYALSDRLIVHSRSNVGQLAAAYRIPPDKIAVVPHGPLQPPEGSEISRGEARRRLEIGENAKVLLLFGALRRYKGVDVALAAVRKLVRVHPEVLLLIAGSLWERGDRYPRMIERLGLERNVRCRFEYVPEPDVSAYLRAADVVLLPYHHFAGQSGVGALALSFGLPLVVSRVGGLEELVLDPASAVPPGDSSGLAARLLEILEDPSLSERLSSDSRQIAGRTSWRAIAEATMEQYRLLAGDLESRLPRRSPR